MYILKCSADCITQFQLRDLKNVGEGKKIKKKKKRLVATFCATMLYLSRASLVCSEGSKMLLPMRSGAAVDGSD